MSHASPSPKIVDLFCGGGGLSLGARNAGFEVSLAVDVDPVLTSSHRRNFPDGRLLLADVSQLSGSDIIREAGGRVDGIVGGPPCQGFSEVGLDRPNDPRRALLRHFFRLVAEVRPAFFLMENVRGLAFAKNRPDLDASLSLVARSYEILGPLKLNAADFGAATSRPRVFVIGYDRTRWGSIREEDILRWQKPRATVMDAISDLSGATKAGVDSEGYDWWRYKTAQALSLYARRLRGTRRLLTGHRQVPHAPAVLARFSVVPPGGKDVVGRHVRLDWSSQCPTLRAGTGPEQGSFQSVRPLHPEEPRVITVREAARLQGFPDRFIFHPTVWHSFRMIGNSVSPMAAERILKAIRARAPASSMLVAAE